MSKDNKCPKCGGERIEVDIGVGTQFGPCLKCGYGDMGNINLGFKEERENNGYQSGEDDTSTTSTYLGRL